MLQAIPCYALLSLSPILYSIPILMYTVFLRIKLRRVPLGETNAGVYICVDNETMTNLTAAHEIGHTLGLVYFVFGLMPPRGDQKERMPLVLPSSVWEIVSKAMNPNERKDDNQSGKRVRYILKYL